MNFSLIPSLKHIANVKIVLILLSEYDIPCVPFFVETSDLNANHPLYEKINRLYLPERIKKNTKRFIKPIAMQVLAWMDFHNNYQSLIARSTDFCWKACGIIDYKKTAELLVQNERLDVVKRFELACVYCLVDKMYKLWGQLPNGVVIGAGGLNSILVFCWLRCLNSLNPRRRDGIYILRTYRECMFICSAASGNLAAIQFFIQNIGFNDYGKILITAAKMSARYDYVFSCGSLRFRYNISEVLVHLLSIMSERNQSKMFQRMPVEIFTSLLKWSWYGGDFMKMLEHMRRFLHREHYSILLEKIADKTLEYNTEQHYQNLFAEFWQTIPARYTEYVIQDCIKKNLFSYFCQVRENISSVFRYVDYENGMEILFHHNQSLCGHLISNEHWDLFAFIVKEFSLSRNSMIKLKEDLRITWHSLRNA